MVIALAVLTIGYYFAYLALEQDILSHSVYDSYTRQALAWWDGRTDLHQNYSWLELATYDGNIYVGFAPVPSVIMFFLTPVFGDATPNNLAVTLYVLLSFVVAYQLCKRRSMPDSQALFWSLFLVMGGNLVAISVDGGVWFQAQALSFLLTLLSLYFMTGEKRSHWHAGLACWVLAIGCRPLQALYFPLYLYLLLGNVKTAHEKATFRRLASILPYAVLPLLISTTYCWYNWIRFDNPLEFGHNLTAEGLSAQHGQFSLHYIRENFANIFRLPTLLPESIRITFPQFNGFLFFLANPLFIPFFIRLCSSIKKRTITFQDIAIPVLIVIHIFLFLSHKTLGGWQFGTRYFINFLPYIFFYICWREPRFRSYEILLLAFGLCLNLYGTLWLHLNWK